MANPTEDQKILAQEADRLRTDRPFAEAITIMRKEAVEALVNVDVVEDPNKARQLQANIRAIDALCTEIAAMILRGNLRSNKPVA